MALACTALACPHCDRAFSATQGIFGKDATQLRDAHVSICEANPRNICFCGAIFPNSVARDSHAVICEQNPANRFKCLHCAQEFLTSFGLLNRVAMDGKTLRDRHAAGCEDNPRNRCFCGAVFPNSSARDKHAVTCEKNPANWSKCPHCPQEFLTSFGYMGRVATDGKAVRDAHAEVCKDNRANTCFCGNLFQNPEARNAHAVVCDKNPANHYDCQFCKADFVKTFNMFGFCSNDGRAEREAHQVCCEKNPKNVCVCGGVFPNPTARDRHATTCVSNPMNRFQCNYCQRLFTTRFGLMGCVAYNGKGQRDAHEVGCEKNPENVCHCGQLFLSPSARDAHAVKCEMNPANRFSCQHCRKTFVTTFGLFSSNGGQDRDAHMQCCTRNPANATCEHCNSTFTEPKGALKWLQGEAHQRCKRHAMTCEKNPRNRFNCERCGKCFAGGGHWVRGRDGRAKRDMHREVCDCIPCAYQLHEADITSWQLLDLSELHATEEVNNSSDDGEECTNTKFVESEEGILVDVAECKSHNRLADNCGGFSEDVAFGSCHDMGDSGSTCFYDAESSRGDASSESGDVSSIHDFDAEDCGDGVSAGSQHGDDRLMGEDASSNNSNSECDVSEGRTPKASF